MFVFQNIYVNISKVLVFPTFRKSLQVKQSMKNYIRDSKAKFEERASGEFSIPIKYFAKLRDILYNIPG